jgi:hypothetical protein
MGRGEREREREREREVEERERPRERKREREIEKGGSSYNEHSTSYEPCAPRASQSLPAS